MGYMTSHSLSPLWFFPMEVSHCPELTGVALRAAAGREVKNSKISRDGLLLLPREPVDEQPGVNNGIGISQLSRNSF